MKNFVLDTNIIVFLVRDQTRSNAIELIGLHETDRRFIISIVTIGELESFGLQNKWGRRKFAKMNDILDDIVTVSLEYESILENYAQIDAFSQGRHPSKKLNDSSRNMGKNDLWIAATVAAIDATLITTDTDFDHFDGQFIDLVRIKREELL